MRVSGRGQITIPKALRDQFGINQNVEVEMIPTKHGMLIQKRTSLAHPVEQVYGLLRELFPRTVGPVRRSLRPVNRRCDGVSYLGRLG